MIKDCLFDFWFPCDLHSKRCLRAGIQQSMSVSGILFVVQLFGNSFFIQDDGFDMQMIKLRSD